MECGGAGWLRITLWSLVWRTQRMVHSSLSVLPGALTFSNEDRGDTRGKGQAREVRRKPRVCKGHRGQGIQLLRMRRNQMKSKKIRTDKTVGSRKFAGDPLSHWYPMKETSGRIIHFIRIAICPHTSLPSAMIIFNPLSLLWSTQGWKENIRILNWPTLNFKRGSFPTDVIKKNEGSIGSIRKWVTRMGNKNTK